MDITVTVNDLREIFNQRKRLRFLRFSFTQRTQRKRLRLNGNRALAYNIRPAFKQKKRQLPESAQSLTKFPQIRLFLLQLN